MSSSIIFFCLECLIKKSNTDLNGVLLAIRVQTNIHPCFGAIALKSTVRESDSLVSVHVAMVMLSSFCSSCVSYDYLGSIEMNQT